MRLLIAFVLTGCYDPSIGDCQFRCAGNDDCPDGTTCRDDFCRTATGSCPMATNDAMNPCPGTPQPPASCGTRFTLENDGCGVLCGTTSGGSERSYPSAKLSCMQAGWQLAVLDTIAKLDAVPASERMWVGAERPGLAVDFTWLSGAVVIPESWTGNPPTPTQGEDCAVITSSRLRNDFNCNDTEPYVCTFPPR